MASSWTLTQWLLNCFYNPRKNNIRNHLKTLSGFLNLHFLIYEKVLTLDDLDVEVVKQNMKIFCDSYSLTSLIKQSPCYKNRSHPTCIDLNLTNVPQSFQTLCAIETRLADSHLMALVVTRKSFKKLKLRVINDRFYKQFSNEVFSESLFKKLSQQAFINNNYGFENFCNVTFKILDKYASRKAKRARDNQMTFITSDLFKNVMKRSWLRNK